MHYSYSHADSEESIVVDDRVVGAERAEYVGELTNGLAVGGSSGKESEIARSVGNMHIHWDE